MGNQQVRNRPVLGRVEAAIPQSQALGQDDRGHSRVDVRLGEVGLRFVVGILKILRDTWDRVKHKNVTCVSLASLFSVVFVVPPIMIFGDRSLPFEYGLAYAKNEYLVAGGSGTIVFTVKGEPKKCKGEFSRYFTDAQGNRFFLGTFRTSYQQGLANSTNGRVFEKDWVVPLGAQPGPGLYETEPYFWCNWFQELYPIQAIPVKIKVTIIRH